MLQDIAKVKELIAGGRRLLLAGSETALTQLPTGRWIGGSIPYFMDVDGGVCSEDRVFVTEIPDSAPEISIRHYDSARLAELYRDAPVNGFTFMVVPAGTPFLETFARSAVNFEEFLLRPIVGWVTGVKLSDADCVKPVVVDGSTGRIFTEEAVAMHVTLPANQLADVQIVNIFGPGSGDVFTFPTAGFKVRECMVNGKPANFAEYIAKNVDHRLPLTADYAGSILNLSVHSSDPGAGEATLLAPVFPGIEYRFAAPVENYARAFAEAVPNDEPPLFSCNCILNYLYGELEGNRTGNATGPFTFGEIAHQLLNQTMIELRIREAV